MLAALLLQTCLNVCLTIDHVETEFKKSKDLFSLHQKRRFAALEVK
jgi:hypothetical protein